MTSDSMSPSNSSFGIVDLEPELLHTLAECVATAVLAEHEIRARQADVLRTHDLVRRSMTQHAVLMDAGFVCERVLADDRFVARYRHPGDLRDETARRIQARRVDVGRDAEKALARLDGHRDFLERAIARALADPVDRAFDLSSASTHCRKAVRHGHPEIVVTVNRQDDLVDAADVLLQIGEDFVKLLRHGIADRIRNVHCGGAGRDHGLDNLRQEFELGARGIFRGELDVLAQAACELHAVHGSADDFILRHVELVFAMDRARGEEHVDARLGSILKRLPSLFDILAIATCEARDDRALHFLRNPVDGLPIAARGDREPRFDDVDAQLRQRLRNSQLLGLRHAAPRRLFAVAQRRIEDQYAIRVGRRHRDLGC
jgi:hypothetical protein